VRADRASRGTYDAMWPGEARVKPCKTLQSFAAPQISMGFAARFRS
jgi:hypothetical protein